MIVPTHYLAYSLQRGRVCAVLHTDRLTASESFVSASLASATSRDLRDALRPSEAPSCSFLRG